MWIAYDIETIPNEKAKDYFENIKVYKAPSNYTDPVKIEEYIQKKREKDAAKGGLYWYTGQIICITVENVLNRNKDVFYGDNEHKLLVNFLEFMRTKVGNRRLIGKSANDFDLPFIKGRILAHDLGFVDALRDWNIRDVDEIFSHSRSCGQRGKLNDYAFGLGIDMKGFDGSMVHDMYKEGRHDEIKEYCAYDTHIVAEMLRRYGKDFVVPDITDCSEA